jgi:hypothetical protein
LSDVIADLEERIPPIVGASALPAGRLGLDSPRSGPARFGIGIEVAGRMHITAGGDADRRREPVAVSVVPTGGK